MYENVSNNIVKVTLMA